MKYGITIAGNIIVDAIKFIDDYPKPGNLVNIKGMRKSIGGCVSNTIIDVARMDRTVPLAAIGKVGDDDNGAYALDILKGEGVDTSRVQIVKGEPTAFTDVMTVISTGDRTFFTMGGAGDGFGFDDACADTIETDIYHLGYALLQAGMDAPDPKYGTVMAKTLAAVAERGIKTSMDVVSEDSPRAKDIILASARQCDYFITNEVEAGLATGIAPRDASGVLIVENMKKLLEGIFAVGVREWAVIHCPEGAWAMHKSGAFYEKGSYILPEGFIKGAVGAGDAFCGAALYGLYKEWDMQDILMLANAAAVACLSESNSIDGMRSIDEIYALVKDMKTR